MVEAPTLGPADRAAGLAHAAEALAVTARQLGADLEEARRALDGAWDRF